MKKVYIQPFANIEPHLISSKNDIKTRKGCVITIFKSSEIILTGRAKPVPALQNQIIRVAKPVYLALTPYFEFCAIFRNPNLCLHSVIAFLFQ